MHNGGALSILYLHFETSLARANQLAEDLQTFIHERYRVYLPRFKAEANTMDAGSVLTIAIGVLGAPTLVAIATVSKSGFPKEMILKSSSLTICTTLHGRPATSWPVPGLPLSLIENC